MFLTMLSAFIICFSTQNVTQAIITGQGTYIINRLNQGKPIITEAMFDAVGASQSESYNINGPSVIRVPSWIEPENRADPNAVYYMYFAHHRGNYIRLAWSVKIEGPWHLYKIGTGVSVGDRGVLDLGSDDQIDLTNGVRIYDHVASPDVFVDEENQRIIMYFHGPSSVDGGSQSQKSFVATSDYGLDFSNGIEPVRLGRFYFRVFEYDGNLYATSNSGYLFKARDPNNPWTPPPGFDFRNDLWIKRADSPFQNDIDSFDFSGVPDTPLRCRHFTVRHLGHTVQMLYTRIGDCPERIKMSTINMSAGDYTQWDPTFPPEEILYAEQDWEGGDLLPENSQGSTAPENVNQLRDPCLFRDKDGKWYLFYCGRGEDAIGVASMREVPKGDFNRDGYADPVDLKVLADEWLVEGSGLKSDLDGDENVDFGDYAIFSKDWTGPDISTPIPNPIIWYSPPATLDSRSIEMTAGYAIDPNGVGVEYYFNNITHPTHDSGWISSPVHEPSHINGWHSGPVPKCFYYLDTDLEPNTAYTYRVKVRDKAANRNETDWSSSQSATTDPLELVTLVLVSSGDSADYYVPTDAIWEDIWMQPGFIVPGTWKSGLTGLGFWGEGDGGYPFSAYNDCFHEEGDSTAANVTDWTIHDDDTSGNTGKLKDFATGSDVGMPTVTFTMGQAGLDVGEPTSGGNPDPGTDAYEIFGDIVDFSGTLVTKGETGWWVEIEFTDLDPIQTYSFVGTAIRAGTYPDRITLCTIIGADSFIWNSNPGVGGSADTAQLQAGDNRSTGYVVRWDDIVPGLVAGPDYSFKVRVEATEDSEDGKAYALGGFMLQGVTGNPDLRTGVRSDMLGVNSSLWMRMEFDLTDDPATIENLTLRMKYEDGFMAYLNGVELERQNFFPDPCTPHWNSRSLSNRPDALANTFEEFDISDHIDDLQLGSNVLAIHGLNYDADDPNFLILPELEATGTFQLTSIPKIDARFNMYNSGFFNLLNNHFEGPIDRFEENYGDDIHSKALEQGIFDHWLVGFPRCVLYRPIGQRSVANSNTTTSKRIGL